MPTTICSFRSTFFWYSYALAWISRWINPSSMAFSMPPLSSIFSRYAPASFSSRFVSHSM